VAAANACPNSNSAKFIRNYIKFPEIAFDNVIFYVFVIKLWLILG
jgi:hypothetical protein